LLVAGGWFVLREKYYWLVADKPSEQGAGRAAAMLPSSTVLLGDSHTTPHKEERMHMVGPQGMGMRVVEIRHLYRRFHLSHVFSLLRGSLTLLLQFC
jgi:hypothetical protein